MKKGNNQIKKVYVYEKLAQETSYVDGKKHGVEKHYYKSGELELEIKFKNNIALSGAYYFQDGSKKEFTKDLLDRLTGLVQKG